MNPIEEQRGNYKSEGATLCSGYEDKQSVIQLLSTFNDTDNEKDKDNDTDNENYKDNDNEEDKDKDNDNEEDKY